MDAESLALFIPIILILVSGTVIISIFYFRSREKHALIDKGFTPAELKELYFSPRRSSSNLLKAGVVVVFFGIGLGLGISFEGMYDNDGLVPMTIFVSTGLGLIVAYYLGKKEDKSFADAEELKDKLTS